MVSEIKEAVQDPAIQVGDEINFFPPVSNPM